MGALPSVSRGPVLIRAAQSRSLLPLPLPLPFRLSRSLTLRLPPLSLCPLALSIQGVRALPSFHFWKGNKQVAPGLVGFGLALGFGLGLGLG